jgi:hypothetical protein
MSESVNPRKPKKSLSVFRSAFNNVRNRYTVLTVTALFVTIFVLGYYFYFLVDRTASLDQRQYRVLNRIEDQLQTNIEGYKGLAIGQVRAAISKIEKDHEIDIRKNPKLFLEFIASDNDSLVNGLAKVSFLRESRCENRTLMFKGAKVQNLNEDRLVNPRASVFLSNLDSVLLIHVDYPWAVGPYKVIIEVSYTLSISGAATPLLRRDMFEDYIILLRDSIIFESKSSGLTKIEFDTLAGDVDNSNRDETANRLVINGVNYRSYRVGFSIGSEPGWSIVGMTSEDSFSKERRILPRSYLFSIFIFAIFLVLSLPFIKSLIMSRTERLNSLDVIFTAVSVGLGTSMVCILLLDGYLKFDVDYAEQTDQLDSLSVQVERHLNVEVDSIARELLHYTDYNLKIDSLTTRLERIKQKDEEQNGRYRSDKVVFDSLVRRDSLLYAQIEKSIDNSTDYVSHVYPGFNNMFLVRNGKTYKDCKEPELQFDVSKRKYASAWDNNECMQMRNVCVPIYLDAINSWREQAFRGVVSIDVIDSNYDACAMTTQLRSLTDPIIPAGYGYCIIDPKGNVLFHSEISRCLNENLIEECDNCTELTALITGRTSDYLDVDYAGTPVKMHVRPMNQLPLFIITFSERAPTDSMHGQVFSVAFILQILLFTFYILIVVFGLLVVRRTSRLHSPILDVSIFTPDVDGTERYVSAILFNLLFGLVLLITASLLQGPLTIIFLFFLSAPYIILLNIILLSNYSFGDVFRKTHRKLFLVIIGAILVVNVIAWNFVSVKWILPLIQAACIFFFYVIENRLYTQKIDGWFNKIVERLDYRRAYNRVVFLLVLLTCVFPAGFFAMHAYNKEKEIAVKTAQLQFMKKINETDYLSIQGPYRKLANYTSSFYNTSLVPVNDTLCDAESYAYDYDGFSTTIRQMVQSTGSEYNRLGYGAYDSLWRWCYPNRNVLTLNGNPISACKPDYNCALQSEVPTFAPPVFLHGTGSRSLRFWFLLGLAVSGLYFVLKLFTRKVFIHEKYSRSRSLKFDQDFLKKADVGYKAFVTGMPSAGKSAYFCEVIKGETPFQIVDFIKYNKLGWKKLVKEVFQVGKGIVLIDHFEHDILDLELTRAKLELIEQLVAMKDKKVIIVSSIQPAVFTHMLEIETEDEKIKAESERVFERWNRVLAAFYVFNFPLQGYEDNHKTLAQEFMELKKVSKLNIPNTLIDLVESECDNGIFLRTIGLELMNELHTRDTVDPDMEDLDKWKEREDLIVRTQKLADAYYRSLWNHLAVEEQFVLYDMAMDGLVNSKNNDIVESLIDKGIIKYDTRLRLMNRSFLNFILTVVGPTDLGILDIEMRHAGSWTKLKPALILIAVTLFLFVIKSDRTQLFGFFMAFAAIIPIVVGVFSKFNQGEKKE